MNIRMSIRSFILTLALLSLPALSAAVYDVQETILENGLKILVLENHKAPTATFQVWYRVGGMDDPFGKTGASHLLEHMMFKGTQKYGPKTFSQTIKRAGGVDNAFTSRDFSGYFQLLSADRLDLSVEMEADRMNNLLLKADDVLSERDVVKEERRMRYEDDPQSIVYEELMASTFKTHPYRQPVIGWMDDLSRIDRDDLVAHYRRYYAPNNAVVLVIGDVSGPEIVEKIRKQFGAIPRGPDVSRPAPSEAPQFGPRRVVVRKEAELPYLLANYKTPAMPHRDSYALDVLSTILSEGKSSRIYRSLVYEQKVALSAWAGYDGLSKGPGVFSIGGTSALGRTSAELEAALLTEIEKIKTTPPTEQEVRKAKNQTEASFILEQDSIYMQARTLGSFEMAGGWRMIDSYLDGIRAVTAEDVQRVARLYLTEDQRTTAVLDPLKKQDGGGK